MRELHKVVLSVAVLILVGAVGVPLGGRFPLVFAEEERPEGEAPGEPVRKAIEAREKEEVREREAERKILSDEALRLLKEAKQLETQGKPEAAAELRAKAKRIKGEYKLRTVVDKLKSNLRIRPEKGTRLITIRRENPDKEEARLVADMVARAKKEWKEGRERKEELVSDEAFRLLREAKELEAQGRPDEAERLRGKAKAVEAEARARKERGEPREEERAVRVKLLERLHGDMLAAKRKLEELGQEYGAKHPRILAAEKAVRTIREQIRAVEAGNVKTEKAPEREGRVGPDEVRGLLEKAERIETEARRQAQELRQKAERIEAGLREKREGEVKREAAEQIEAAIREHLEVAERLRAEGKGDAAEEHVRKAETLKRELAPRVEIRPVARRPEEERFVRERREGEEEPRLRREAPAPELVREPRPVRPEEPRPGPEPFVGQPVLGPAFIGPQVAELRREVNQLREELAHIRELLQQLLERQAPPLR